MSSYQITLKDRSTERVDGADAYQQEGPMTTFFRTGSGRDLVDTWSTRVASYRTAELLAVRRLEPTAPVMTERAPHHEADRRPGCQASTTGARARAILG
ncbi:MAG TPA: hypothetical protein VHK88_05405 [Aquihabitans sp.]|jgi:hypothetical protein|nr:hypothetical protein [Aquihabitans sp.]